ncbi:hypothetical protein LCI18_001774 [Fusarium solani-melongenae]|uniref:Uncharacterized protein n=1 Tax=Fusarium solani subsp. cucurbitae TaxID=2747967 RepID=A0ACD3YPF4_FUSSC|nr:hypothetical protein LCI18_001774 [Fusarium solani-melongenae]
MAKQRELFLCLANSCGEDYGPALAFTISVCANYGALITDLLPVELQQAGLPPRRFSHLIPRLDAGRFAFGDQFNLAVDCAAGSNGVLTLSLPKSVPSGISQPPPTGDSPLVPGSGAGDPNLGSSSPAGNTNPNFDPSSPAGNPDPVLGSQRASPSTSHGDQSETFAHAASNNLEGNENPSSGVGNSAAVDADCDPETESSNNGQAQHHSGSPPNDIPLQAQALCRELMPAIRPLAIVKEHQAARMMALALVLVPKAQVPALGTTPEAHPLVPIKKHQGNLHLSLLLYQWPRIQPRRPLLKMPECLVMQVLQKEPGRIAKMTLLPRLALVLQGTLPLNRRLETKATQ